MARRNRGLGAVFLRADGRWEGQIRIGGGRRRSFYARTRRDLVRKLADARWALGEGLPVSAGTQSLRTYLELKGGKSRSDSDGTPIAASRAAAQRQTALPRNALTSTPSPPVRNPFRRQRRGRPHA